MNDIDEANKIFNFIIYANDTTLSTTLAIMLKDRNNQTINAELALTKLKTG